MKIGPSVPSVIIAVICLAGSTFAQQETPLANNAALRYWSAFSDMQDTGVTAQQAKELNAVLEGTAPYDDTKYKDLVEKNRPALQLMARGTSLSRCDWGLDYAFGENVPVEYAREALALGRLNVLYAFHLMAAGDTDGAVNALSAGLRFSKDVASGGTLFATSVATGLILNHLRAVESVLQSGNLSPAQRLTLQQAVARLGSQGVDWQSAIKREMEVLRTHFPHDAQASASLTQIASAYANALNAPSGLTSLRDTMHNAPPQVAELIPSPEPVLKVKQRLIDQIAQTRSLLR
jgi:hypothetical protein